MKSFKFFLIVAGLFLVNFLLRAQTGSTLSAVDVFKLAEDNIEMYRKGDVLISVVNERGKPLKGASISVKQTTQDFLFGALLFDLTSNKIDPEREKLFKERFLELFNYGIIPFYWGGYEYNPGQPQWMSREKILNWCIENGITAKGHPLAWTNTAGMPSFIYDLSLEDSEMLLKSRIFENVLGFDQVSIWDVVNEPTNMVSWEMALKDKEGKRRYDNSIPLAEIEDWVEEAFNTAHRANPDKHLVLNEFKQFADKNTRSRFYTFVDDLLKKGTPINGLGIQAHEPRQDWYSPVDVWETLNLYAEFNLPVHITEFSPQSRGAAIEGGYRTGTWTEETQAEFAEMMYKIWFGHPSVKSINWWGFSDVNGWLPGCGITDDDLNPKPVYSMLKKLIKEDWMTKNLDVQTNNKGIAGFRGFFGEYNVLVSTKDGATQSVNFHLHEGVKNEWQIKLK